MNLTISRFSKRSTANIFLVALLFSLFFAAGVTPAAAGTVRVTGSADICKGLFEVLCDQIREESGIVLEINPSPPTLSLIDLDMGATDIVVTDQSLATLIDEIRSRGFFVLAENFHEQGISTNNILIYVHKDNPVVELNQQQLRDIFSGRIRNWKAITGVSHKIVVVSGDDSPGQHQLFSSMIMGTSPLHKNILKVADQKALVNYIASNPGAIGIASHAYKSSRTRNPKTPFLSLKVTAITKGAPSKDAQQALEIVKAFDF